jgi:hypothetical protein
MFFGQSMSFRVEAFYIQTIDSRLYGNFCLHIADRQIGDLDSAIELTSSVRWARIFLREGPRRVRADLDSATAGEVFDILYQRYISGASQLRGEHEDVVPRCELESWDRDPYLIDDIGESSIRDKYTILVIGTGNGDDRVILKSYTEGTLNEFLIRNGDIDSAFREYCTWVDNLYGAPVLPPT